MSNAINKLPFYVKLSCTLISILLLGWLAILGQTILIPLILGLIIAILLVPFCNLFERYLYIPRNTASILGTLVFFSLILGIFYVIVLELLGISQEWSSFQKQIIDMVDHLQKWISNTYGISSKKQVEYLNENISKTFNFGTVVVEKILSSLTRYSILICFTFLYVLFILMYRRHLVRFLFYLFEEKNYKELLSIIAITQKMIKQYLMGLFIQIAIVFSLTFLALNFLEIKYAFLIALITGVFNIIPYVGIITSALIASILTLATSGQSEIIFVLISYVMVHAIDANIVMPKIVGSKVKVNSLIVIIGLVVGELVWGIMGMFLSIPILAISKIIFDHVPELKPWGFLLGEQKGAKLNPKIEHYFVDRPTIFKFNKKNESDDSKNNDDDN